jgi:hypothetical protein
MSARLTVRMDQDRAVARGTEVSIVSQPSGNVYENNRAVQIVANSWQNFPAMPGKKWGRWGKSLVTSKQCYGSVTFWYGTGPADPCL